MSSASQAQAALAQGSPRCHLVLKGGWGVMAFMCEGQRSDPIGPQAKPKIFSFGAACFLQRSHVMDERQFLQLLKQLSTSQLSFVDHIGQNKKTN